MSDVSFETSCIIHRTSWREWVRPLWVYVYPVKCEALFGFCVLGDKQIKRFANNWKKLRWNVHVTRDGEEVGKIICQKKNRCSRFAAQQTTVTLHVIWQHAIASRFIGDNCVFVYKVRIVVGVQCKQLIVHTVLGFQKLLSKWMPRVLTEEHIKNRMAPALLFLSAYEWEDVVSLYSSFSCSRITVLIPLTAHNNRMTLCTSQGMYTHNGSSIMTAVYFS